jgi:hypothetical protein
MAPKLAPDGLAQAGMEWDHRAQCMAADAPIGVAESLLNAGFLGHSPVRVYVPRCLPGHLKGARRHVCSGFCYSGTLFQESLQIVAQQVPSENGPRASISRMSGYQPLSSPRSVSGCGLRAHSPMG